MLNTLSLSKESKSLMIQTTATITDQELIQLSSQNPELRFERNADGTLVTMT
jgi:Uma2 family endonuclease